MMRKLSSLVERSIHAIHARHAHAEGEPAGLPFRELRASCLARYAALALLFLSLIVAGINFLNGKHRVPPDDRQRLKVSTGPLIGVFRQCSSVCGIG